MSSSNALLVPSNYAHVTLPLWEARPATASCRSAQEHKIFKQGEKCQLRPSCTLPHRPLCNSTCVVSSDSPHRHAASGDAGIFGLVPIASALLQSRPSLCGPLSSTQRRTAPRLPFPTSQPPDNHAIFLRGQLHHFNSLL